MHFSAIYLLNFNSCSNTHFLLYKCLSCQKRQKEILPLFNKCFCGEVSYLTGPVIKFYGEIEAVAAVLYEYHLFKLEASFSIRLVMSNMRHIP